MSLDKDIPLYVLDEQTNTFFPKEPTRGMGWGYDFLCLMHVLSGEDVRKKCIQAYDSLPNSVVDGRKVEDKVTLLSPPLFERRVHFGRPRDLVFLKRSLEMDGAEIMHGALYGKYGD